MATLYAARGGSGASNLYTVNPSTGAMTSVGSTGRSITGLAFDPTSGTLYAITGGASPLDPKTLLTLNPSTGAATVIGATGQSGAALADIAFKADGTLYGYGGTNSRSVYTINKATGAATLVGTGSAGNQFGLGFEIDAAGNGYVFPDGDFGNPTTGARFFDVDLATGAVTQIGRLQNMAFVTSGSITAASFGPDSGMWFVGAVFGAGASSLATIDADGNVTLVGSMGLNNVDALAWLDGVKPSPWYPPGATAEPVDDSYTGAAGATMTVAAPGVLGNDISPTTATLNTNVTRGTLTLNADGSFVYVPATAYVTGDSFTYDGNGGTATVTIILTTDNHPIFDGEPCFKAEELPS